MITELGSSVFVDTEGSLAFLMAPFHPQLLKKVDVNVEKIVDAKTF